MKINKNEYFKLYDKYEKPASTLFHKYVSKKLARVFTYYFLKFNFTPNMMSFFTFVLSVMAVSFLLYFPNYEGILLFLILLQFSYVLDCSDGVVARITKTSSKFGAYFDITLDRLNIMVILTGVGIYHFMNNDFKLNELYIYLISSIFYINYQILSTIRPYYFPELNGYMKKKQKSLIQQIIKLIYEFIDTGIFYFILSVSLFFNIEIYTMLYYGIISLLLSVGNYIVLYNRTDLKKNG